MIVDMQDFFLKNLPAKVKNILVDNQIKVIDAAVKEKLPFFVLEYKCRRMLRGPTISKIADRLKRADKKIIIKESNSGFTATGLDAMLASLGVKEIILVGINANGCVQDTAIAALHRGYAVTVAEGAVASCSRGNLSLSKKNKEWFKENTRFFGDAESLILYIHSRR